MSDDGRLVAIKIVDTAIEFIKANGRQNSTDCVSALKNALKNNLEKDKSSINCDCFINKDKQITIRVKRNNINLDYLYKLDLVFGGSCGDIQTPCISLYFYKPEMDTAIRLVMRSSRPTARGAGRHFDEPRGDDSYHILNADETSNLITVGN